MPATIPVQYRIAVLDARAHLFEVQCRVATPDAAGQRFRLPTWIPGSYLIREFARQFTRVYARDTSGPVAIGKEGKDVWRAAPCAGPLTVIAEIYAFDLSVRTAYLDDDRGFFNGPSVFLCPDGFADVACEVEIVAPEDKSKPQFRWRVATAMPRRSAAPYGFGKYGAENYDALIDHPVEMSDFTLASFEAGGAVHDIAISGRHRADTGRLTADLQKVCTWQCDLFRGAPGGRAPFDRYVFLVAAVGEGYGGLEHRASTSLLCKRDELPLPGMSGVSAEYRTLLGLASHEYFHSWNVKRIKPAAFTPYDLSHESYTRQLWAFEGITSYYDDLALVRSGVITIDDFLELLGRTMTAVLRGPGRAVQSVAESSFDAWIKFYRQDENSPNALVSYYAKGSLVALALDLTLRRHGASLDVVMRALWQRYGQTAVGVPEDGIPRLATEIAGVPLDDFFTRYVYGTEDPPLAELLEELGIALHVRSTEGDTDRGGKRGKHNDHGQPRVWIGAKLAAGSEPRLQHVYRNGPAERAGLAAGDVLVAIDGLRASADALEKLCSQHVPGDTVAVHAFRRDELKTMACTLVAAPRDTCWLALEPAVGDEVGARRAAWLGRA